MRRRWLCLVLTLALTVGLLPSAGAMSDQAWDDAQILYDLGLMKGTIPGDGSGESLALERTATRAEGVTMLVRLLGKESQAQERNYPTDFSDVPGWAAPYVGYAVHEGLTNGVGGGRFGSDELITATQYTTLVLRAIGYDETADHFTWETALDKAVEIGMFDAVVARRLALGCDRGDIATISRSALMEELPYAQTDEERYGYLTLAQKLAAEGVFSVELGKKNQILPEDYQVPGGAQTPVISTPNPSPDSAEPLPDDPYAARRTVIVWEYAEEEENDPHPMIVFSGSFPIGKQVELPYKSMYGDLFIMTRITINGKPLGGALPTQDAPRYVTVGEEHLEVNVYYRQRELIQYTVSSNACDAAGYRRGITYSCRRGDEVTIQEPQNVISGYSLTDVLVNGVSKGAVHSLTLTPSGGETIQFLYEVSGGNFTPAERERIEELNRLREELGTAHFSGSPYLVEPNLTPGSYDPGALETGFLLDGLNELNYIRIVAGLPGDITYTSDRNEIAQAGALLLYANGELDHTPAQPEGMEEALYQMGYSATSSADIARGYKTLREANIGYMFDDGNWSTMGHRRWLLSPKLKTVGMGYVERFSDITIFDESRSPAIAPSKVCWPCEGLFPLEFADENLMWTCSLNRESYALSQDCNLTVTMTRLRDGAVFHLDTSMSDVDSGGAYLSISMGDYGFTPAILFRPGVSGYVSGEAYHVSIENVPLHNGGTTTIEYTTKFFE